MFTLPAVFERAILIVTFVPAKISSSKVSVSDEFPLFIVALFAAEAVVPTAKIAPIAFAGVTPPTAVIAFPEVGTTGAVMYVVLIVVEAVNPVKLITACPVLSRATD